MELGFKSECTLAWMWEIKIWQSRWVTLEIRRPPHGWDDPCCCFYGMSILRQDGTTWHRFLFSSVLFLISMIFLIL